MLLSKEDIAEILEDSYCEGNFELSGDLLKALLPFTSHAEELENTDVVINRIDETARHVLFLIVRLNWGRPIPDFEKIADDLKEWKFADGFPMFPYVNIQVEISLHRSAEGCE
jgi:hypothetical protein